VSWPTAPGSIVLDLTVSRLTVPWPTVPWPTVACPTVPRPTVAWPSLPSVRSRPDPAPVLVLQHRALRR
jgi:hypothetical protein